MKLQWALLCVFILYMQDKTTACDVCGCSVSGQNFGIIPKFHQHFAGLRYSYKSFASTHQPLLSTETETYSREYFSNVELWSRVRIGEKFQLFAYIPYSVISKVTSTSKYINNGPGDVSVTGMYSVINQKISTDGKMIHNLQMGGGIKLPTGDNSFETDEGWLPSIQSGTGTVDFFANINYILRFNNAGFQTEAGYRINTFNKPQDFRFGNRLNFSMRSFYIHHIRKSDIITSAGVLVENAQSNFHEGVVNELSGGNSVFGQLGIDFIYGNTGFGTSFSIPLYDNMAEGNVRSKPRIQAQALYFF